MISKSLSTNFFSCLFKKDIEYHSKFLDKIFKIGNKCIDIIRINNATILSKSFNFPWKEIVIFLFLISLSLAPSSQITTSELPTGRISTQAITQQTFGIVIFSLSNIFLIPLLLFVIRRYNKDYFKIKNFDIFLLVFFIISEISVITSININASFVWFLRMSYGLILYFIFSHLTLSKKIINILLYSFLATVFYESAIAFIQFIKGGLIGLPIESPLKIDPFILKQVPQDLFIAASHFRAVGTFSHPNLLSSYFMFFIPIFIICFYHKNQYIRIASYCAFFLIMITTLLTFSRWSLFMNLITVFFTFIFLIKTKKNTLSKHITNTIKILFIVFIAIFSFVLSDKYLSQRFLQFSIFQDVSLNTRLNLIQQSIYTIQHNPFGVGGGAFLVYLENFDTTVKFHQIQRYLFNIHNLYLLLLTEMGMIGLLLFLAIIAKIVIMFKDKIKRIPKENQLFAQALFISLLAFFIRGIWEPETFSNRVWFLFCVFLGLLVNILYTKKISTYQ